MEKLTIPEMQNWYKNHIESLNQDKKFAALKKEISKRINKNYKTKSEALPIIDITNFMITEFQQVLGWVDEAYYKFVFKGSRSSGKTTFAAQFILLEMLLDNQQSWFVIMENKVQHSDTTMLEFKQWIDNIDSKWPGYANKWEKSDGQSIKELRFRHNGNYQKIKFIGLDEASKGTITPPSGNYWRGFWIEEVVSSNEQFGGDMSKKKEKFNVLNTLTSSSVRFFSRIENDKKREEKRFIEFWTFNPYNVEEPALENFNKYHPDNKEELKKYGFTFKKNEEEKEAYITSNYLVNPHLPIQVKLNMEKLIKDKAGAWETIVYGITGSPINTVYANIYHITDKWQENTPTIYKELGYVGFKRFIISIDIGNGGGGETTCILMGETLKGVWIPLEEWGSKKYEKQFGYDVEKVISQLWLMIGKWNDKYVDFRSIKSIPIVLDNDPAFRRIFEKAYRSTTTNWKTQFVVNLFVEKYLNAFKNEKRPNIVKYLMTTDYLKLYKEFTSKLYLQWKMTQSDKNGKIQDGYDDYRQAFEMSVFFIAKEIASHNFNNKKLNDKDMINFIKNL